MINRRLTKTLILSNDAFPIFRRLYAWLLGSDVTTGSTSVSLTKETAGDSKPVCDNMKIAETIDQYFKIYSKDLLISVSHLTLISDSIINDKIWGLVADV